MGRDDNGFSGRDQNDQGGGGRRRGHQNGAFRHLNNQPHDNDSNGRGSVNQGMNHHRPSSPSQRAQNDLNGLGKASGINGKLNDIGRGIGEVGKKDPNLERLGNGFGSAKSLGSGLAGAGRRTGAGDNGMQGKPNEKAMQSGLADPDKQPERQQGDPSKQPANNGMGNNNDDNPLKKYGSAMPQQLANLGGKVNKTYNKFMGGLVSGVQKAGKLAHLTIGKSTALWVAKALMTTTIVGGLFGAAYLYENNDDVLDGGNVCSTQNTGDVSYSDAADSSGGGAADLDNPNAKKIFEFFTKKDGFSGAGASGAVAVAQRESGFDPKAKNAGGGVAGIFQWSGWGNTVNGDRIHQGGFIKSESDLTLENEFKLVNYEFKHGHGDVPKVVGNAKDPGQAALDWSEKYEGVSLADGQTKGSQIQAWAQQAYSKFHGSSIKADSAKLDALGGAGNESVANSNAATAEQLNNLNCEGKDQGDVVAGDWDWPFTGFNPDKDVTGEQRFGASASRQGGFHDGIDVGTATHSGDMHSIHGGVVKKIDAIGHTQNDLGYFILIESPDGYCEVYQEFAFSMADGNRVSKVKVGDHVKTGQTIAKLDPTTPGCTHVHIGVYKGKASDWNTAVSNSFNSKWGGWRDPIKIIQESKGKK